MFIGDSADDFTSTIPPPKAYKQRLRVSTKKASDMATAADQARINSNIVRASRCPDGFVPKVG
jgi:hypothetical protein